MKTENKTLRSLEAEEGIQLFLKAGGRALGT
jgi:hypothetical protein